MQLLDVQTFSAEDATASGAWTALVEAAVGSHASDIHLTWQSDGLHVAVRVDGQLAEQGCLTARDTAGRLVNHVKILGALDVGEHRRPQDGRAIAVVDDNTVDLRISTLPTGHGEDVVVRILDRTVSVLSLDELGLGRREMNRLLGLLEGPSGLVLVTGATGAGKTTTLYAMLSRLSGGARKIVTIEDPIEYDLPGISQSQVNAQIGVGCATLLRTVLRQDADIILIGEVNDPETAAAAVRAAATGHLVFATMHAVEATGAIESLINLGANPHLVARSLRGVVAQCLVRRVCPDCAERIAETAAALPLDDIKHLLSPDDRPALAMGRGCESCHRTGYRGRMALFEILVATDKLRAQIEQRQPDKVLHQAAVEDGMWSIHQAGKVAAFRGQTTVEELLRMISD